MSCLDLDEFLSNIKQDFLSIIDSKNLESVEEFNNIQSLLEGCGEPAKVLGKNIDEEEDGEIN